MKVSVRAPATVANLGPGFDCMALALDLHNVFSVDTEAPPGVEVVGEGAEELADPARNLVLRTIQREVTAAGESMPEFGLVCENRIPLERGLGSSASAVVGGLLLADRLLGRSRSASDLLSSAVAAEGHPDNVAACLSGGIVLVYRDGDEWREEPFEPHPDLRAVVLVPENVRVSTELARSALPATVAFEDAAFNVSRGALAVIALSRRPELLGAALDDRLHQQARLALAPESGRMFEAVRESGVAVCVAGSGPSLLAFESAGNRVPDPGPGWRVLRVRIARFGAGEATPDG